MGVKKFDFGPMNRLNEIRNIEIMDLPDGISRLKSHIIMLKSNINSIVGEMD